MYKEQTLKFISEGENCKRKQFHKGKYGRKRMHEAVDGSTTMLVDDVSTILCSSSKLSDKSSLLTFNKEILKKK